MNLNEDSSGKNELKEIKEIDDELYKL